MTQFKDHFSSFSGAYAKGRLQYPRALFDFLAAQSSKHELAWDCGTGNGQVAIDLVEHYKQVVATDPSEGQINHARQHPRVSYFVEPAESSSLGNQSVDLVTVGVALHWFNHDDFYKEVKRVLKPGGLIAAWAYFLPNITPEIDELLSRFAYGPLQPYWKPEIKYIHEGYRTIPFPFEEIDTPFFRIEKKWDLSQMITHIYTWSAVQLYMKDKGTDPVADLGKALIPAWGQANQEKEISWKMPLRVGRHV